MAEAWSVAWQLVAWSVVTVAGGWWLYLVILTIKTLRVGTWTKAASVPLSAIGEAGTDQALPVVQAVFTPAPIAVASPLPIPVPAGWQTIVASYMVMSSYYSMSLSSGGYMIPIQTVVNPPPPPEEPAPRLLPETRRYVNLEG